MRLSDAFWKMAEHFMEVVHSETGLPVLIYDDTGVIVRATDTSRIGDLHAGAEKIMQGLVDEYAVSPEEAAHNPLVREGFSCPITVEGRRAAAFGITGKLALTRPLAKVAVRLIHSWIEDSEHLRQLKRSEHKYRSIFDHSAQGIFQATLEGRMLTANRALARMYGFPSPEALRAALTDVSRQLYVDPLDRHRLIAKLRADGEITHFSTRFRRHDGEIIDVNINAHFVSDPETGQRLIEGIVEDVTARRKAEEALRLSEEKYAKAFNSSPVLVVLSVLETGRYVEVNETFERVMEYEREAVIGRTSLDVGTWADPADRGRILQAIEKDGCVRGFEARRRTRSGRILTVLYFAEVIDVAGETCMLSVALDITERKRAEEKLRLSQNNLKITLDAIGDGVIVTDTDGVVMRMNPSAEDLTGWPAPEAIGRPLPEVFDVIHARTQEPLNRQMEAVMAGADRIARAGHTVLAARDGREHVIADSAAPIRDADGEVVGVVLVFRDVTESYAHEQRIRERDDLLKRLSANIPGVIYQFYATPAREYGLRYVSAQAAEMFGMDAPLDTFFDALFHQIPAEEQKDFLASIDAAVNAVSPWHYEGRFIKPTGETRWFSGNALPHMDGDDVVFDGVLIDITGIKQAEARLKDAHQRFLTVLESIDATIYVADMETFEILYMNEKMKQVFGGDFTGHLCFEVFRNEPRQCAVCTNDRLVDADGQPTEGCIWENKNPVTRRWYANYDRAIQWVDGRIVRLQVATDISEQKAIETERQDYEVRIQQMQKMEAIGVLAGGIAHDFNNILSAVIGFAELTLFDTNADSPIYGNLRQIQAAGMRARDLVQQILTFSRQDEKELKPLQIGSQVKEALKMLRSSLPTTIEMHVEIAPRVGNVMADPTQIHQIVMNLCTNAAQEMEDRGGRLTVRLDQTSLDAAAVRLRPGLQAGSYARLCIQDSGGGIPPDIVDKIFNPYFTTKEKGKGTGLGLAVVHGIVQSYGGDIRVESTIGQGTRFTVYLPVIQAVAESPVEQAALPMGHERILLVDDEAVIVAFGRQGLERLGYRVEGCTSSTEALEHFRQAPERYDLVITDMTMPNMTGDQLARKIFKLRKKMPVILCTGYSSRIDGPRAKKMGISALLMKPLNLSDLALNIRRVLDGRKGRR